MKRNEFVFGLILGSIAVIFLEVFDDGVRLVLNDAPWLFLFIGYPVLVGTYMAIALGIGETLLIIFKRRFLKGKEETANGVRTGMKFGGGITLGMIAALLTFAIFK